MANPKEHEEDKKPTKTYFRRGTIKEENRGTLIKECAGWKIYFKETPTGKKVCNVYKNKETKPNKTDWNIIKGDIYTNTGFKWGKFSNFEKWGSSINEISDRTTLLCEILQKYYGGENKEGESSKKPYPFMYGDGYGVPEDAGKLLIEELQRRGFLITPVADWMYFTINKDGKGELAVNDNGGEFNLFNAKSQGNEGSIAYDTESGIVSPFNIAGLIEKYYYEIFPTRAQDGSADKEDLQKAIKGLQILADKGSDRAKKAIVGLQYLLNKK